MERRGYNNNKAGGGNRDRTLCGAHKSLHQNIMCTFFRAMIILGERDRFRRFSSTIGNLQNIRKSFFVNDSHDLQ